MNWPAGQVLAHELSLGTSTLASGQVEHEVVVPAVHVAQLASHAAHEVPFANWPTGHAPVVVHRLELVTKRYCPFGHVAHADGPVQDAQLESHGEHPLG